jgi:hypothetical protein
VPGAAVVVEDVGSEHQVPRTVKLERRRVSPLATYGSHRQTVVLGVGGGNASAYRERSLTVTSAPAQAAARPTRPRPHPTSSTRTPRSDCRATRSARTNPLVHVCAHTGPASPRSASGSSTS